MNELPTSYFSSRDLRDDIERYAARIGELEAALKAIAFSARTKTGMKEMARAALYGEKK